MADPLFVLSGHNLPKMTPTVTWHISWDDADNEEKKENVVVSTHCLVFFDSSGIVYICLTFILFVVGSP